MEELRIEVEKKLLMLLEVKGHLKQLTEKEREREGRVSCGQRERGSQRTSQDGELLLDLPCNTFNTLIYILCCWIEETHHCID